MTQSIIFIFDTHWGIYSVIVIQLKFMRIVFELNKTLYLSNSVHLCAHSANRRKEEKILMFPFSIFYAASQYLHNSMWMKSWMQATTENTSDLLLSL